MMDSRWTTLMLGLAVLLLAACPSDSPQPAGPSGDAETDVTSDVGGDAGSDVVEPPAFDPLPLVNVFAGTGADGGNVGALYPGPAVPFGMVALSPDTEGLLPKEVGVVHTGGYFYQDTEIMGFSHTHLAGVGVADYGNLLVLPQIGDAGTLTAAPRVANLPLDHKLEFAEPGYYRIRCLEPELTAELTATARTGHHRYTYGPSTEAQLILDLSAALGEGEVIASEVTVDPVTGEASGYLHNVGDFTVRFDGFELYFVARPVRTPEAIGVFDGDGLQAGGTHAVGPRTGVVWTYDTTVDPVVELQVGISFVSIEGARANLEAEATGKTFDEVREAAANAWREALGVVHGVEGGTETRLGLLYTRLYHAQLMPNLLTDVDGQYRGLDKEVHSTDGWLYYSDLSMWDTYRTFHPLGVLLWPDDNLDFLKSLGAMARDGGTMPTWPLATGYTGSMIGTSADVIIADAVDKGQVDWDIEGAWGYMYDLATGPAPSGKPGRDDYEMCTQYGYCPADLVGGSVSKTLEHSTNDYCLARLADYLGKPDEAAFFDARWPIYKELFDPAKGGFFAPRASTGEFLEYSTITATEHYIEGSPWHYSMMVPHDAAGLVELYGGQEAIVERLTLKMEGMRDNFELWLPNGYYFHGNEPDLVSPWMFSFGGRRDLTASWVAWIADNNYTLEQGGLAGNDDGGTLSSWYVFAAAGFYPLPCTGEYVLGAPLFDRIVLSLPGGELEVLSDPDPMATPTFNGQPIEGPTIAHDTIINGGTLVLPVGSPLPPQSE